MQQLRPLPVHRYHGRNSCVPPRSRSSASRREPMTNRARCVLHPSPLSASGEREGPARREGWSSVWSASATLAISRFGPTLRLSLLLVLMASGSVRAQESTQDHAAGARAQQSIQDLAVAAKNPIAAMYSLPFQNNIYGGVGPQHDATANVLNMMLLTLSSEIYSKSTICQPTPLKVPR